jgi:hypothetical protein
MRGGGSEKGGLHVDRGSNKMGEAIVTYRWTKGSRARTKCKGVGDLLKARPAGQGRDGSVHGCTRVAGLGMRARRTHV